MLARQRFQPTFCVTFLRSLSIALSAIFVVACATSISTVRAATSFPLEYVLSDKPDLGKLEVRFTNLTKRAVCLGPENWPQNGRLLNDGKGVSVEVGGKIFFLKPEQDYCPKCSVRVEPGQALDGLFRYSSFNLPPQFAPLPKKLNFAPVGFLCR